VADEIDNCPNHANPDQADCDGDGIGDVCAIATGQSTDCDGNGMPDNCELAGNDCNANGTIDACDIAGGTSIDCNVNTIPDECENNPTCFNDECIFSTTLCVGTLNASTALATNDGDANCGISGTSPDVWYDYTPDTDGTATFSTCGSAIDTVLSLHSGCPGTIFNEIACNDDACGTFDSSIIVPVTAGTTYMLRVSGYNGDAGSYTLTLAGPACSAPAPIPRRHERRRRRRHERHPHVYERPSWNG